MNVRLLIMFGLLIQLLTGHAQIACAAPCSDTTMVAPSGSACTDCCKGDPSERPTNPQDCPREACPLCMIVGSDPNELAVLQPRETAPLFTAPRLLEWSVLIDRANTRRALGPRRVHDPPPSRSRHAPSDTGRWLL